MVAILEAKACRRFILRAKRVVLGTILFLAGCGTGIAVDFTSVDPPKNEMPEGGDGSSDEDGGDASSPPDDDVQVGADVPSAVDATFEGGGSDRAADRPVDLGAEPDVVPDTGDALRDAAVDASIDAARDATDAAPPTDIRTGDSVFDGRRPDGAIDAPLDSVHDTGPLDVGGDGCNVGCGLPIADYYVDAFATPGGDGSRWRPFQTVTAAIDAFGASPGQAKKAYVAAGTYDEALGERFPFVLRGLSLEGAGQDKTIIVGAGTFDHAADGGPLNLFYSVTIVAGDRSLPTRIANLSLHPIAPVPERNFYGVFCDRGNATGEVASPLGQTFFDAVTIGPGYDTSVSVTTSTNPAVTGCNMVMTRSTTTTGWMGVHAIGCDGVATPGPVMLAMGNSDPASGNTVSWMTAQNSSGFAVRLDSCVTRASFLYNALVDGNAGLIFFEDYPGPSSSEPPHPVVIQHNSFERLSGPGVAGYGPLFFAEEISDNRFIGNSTVPNNSNLASESLSVYAANVGKVRRNQFIGNEIAVRIDDGGPDFGTPDDPGNNVFRCNSGRTGTRQGGFDIWYLGGAPIAPGRATVRMAGNFWDHVPPTASTDCVSNGIDICGATSDAFDLTGSSLSTAACPSDREPGP